MKTFIVNSVKGVVDGKRKFDVSSKLVGREWRMFSDEPAVSCKYIFLKDGKLVLSVNGMSTYSTWQMATPTSIIMDEGVGTFLYKIIHLDEDIIVLNLDGTENYCFLINEASPNLVGRSFVDFKWFLFRRCNIDMLSLEEKMVYNGKAIGTGNDAKTGEKEASGLEVIFFLILFFALFGILGFLLTQAG